MSYDTIIGRLETSIDATDRVKAAAELGEVGNPEVAPVLLKAVWEDSQSGVRQAAITSYVEVLGEESIEELEKVISSHFDPYVRLNAISMLPKLSRDSAVRLLETALGSEDEKIRSLAIRELYMLNTPELAPRFVDLLKKETYRLAKRNLIEALALWKYSPAFQTINEILEMDRDPEIQTIGTFALAVLGDDPSKQKLEEMKVDAFLRVKYRDEWYRGRDGLIQLLSLLEKAEN